MSTCPRCGDDHVHHDQRPAIDHYVCLACGWDWDYWPGGEKNPFTIRQLLGLPHDGNPTSRWCECPVPVRYVVTGTLKETVTYCRRCRKYVAIACPVELDRGGHYRALQKRQDELAMMGATA